MTTIPGLPAASSVSLDDLTAVDQSVAVSVSPNGRKTRGATLSQLGTAILPFLNVKGAPFKAKGDGNADDYPAIKAADAAVAAAGGGDLYFPPGTYFTSLALQ